MEAVIVPEMIIKLKQGVGRLVRTKQDKGLLVLLDSRMNKPIYKHKKQYQMHYQLKYDS